MNTVSIDPKQATCRSLDIVSDLGSAGVHRPGLVSPVSKYREHSLLSPVIDNVRDPLPLVVCGLAREHSNRPGTWIKLDLASYAFWDSDKLFQYSRKDEAKRYGSSSVIDNPCVKLSSSRFMCHGVGCQIRKTIMCRLTPGSKHIRTRCVILTNLSASFTKSRFDFGRGMLT